MVPDVFWSDLRVFEILRIFKNYDFDFVKHFMFIVLDGDLDSPIRFWNSILN